MQLTRTCQFTESQIAAILKEREAGVSVAVLRRMPGINVPTYRPGK
jgi:hypothetical protein